MTTPSVLPIDPALTINALVERHPHLMPVLAAHGFDLCCGGPLTLTEAADRHGLDLSDLLAELGRALPNGGVPASPRDRAPA